MRIVGVLAVLVLCGCGEGLAARSARAAFESFQRALFAGDRGQLRELVTQESRPVIDQLPLDRVHGKQPLQVRGLREGGLHVYVSVLDPNDGDASGTYVLTREDGELRVDLVATTAFHHEDRARPGGGMSLQPRELSERELAEIRTMPPEKLR